MEKRRNWVKKKRRAKRKKEETWETKKVKIDPKKGRTEVKRNYRKKDSQRVRDNEHWKKGTKNPWEKERASL